MGAHSGEAKFCCCLWLQQVFIGSVESTDRINFRNQQLYSAVSVSGDTLQYKLEESISHRCTGQVTQLFTYLLMHKLSSSCIQWYLASRAYDWVMPALSAVLLAFNVQFSLLFFHVGSQAAAAVYVVWPLSDIGRCRKCGKYVPCMRRTAHGKDFELILTVSLCPPESSTQTVSRSLQRFLRAH